MGYQMCFLSQSDKKKQERFKNTYFGHFAQTFEKTPNFSSSVSHAGKNNSFATSYTYQINTFIYVQFTFQVQCVLEMLK